MCQDDNYFIKYLYGHQVMTALFFSLTHIITIRKQKKTSHEL